MTSAERAKETVAFLVRYDRGLAGRLGDYAENIIAAAITSAQNDKLEEAARAAEQSHLGMSCFVDAVDCGQFNSGVRHAAKAIRSLIEKD